MFKNNPSERSNRFEKTYDFDNKTKKSCVQNNIKKRYFL